MLSVIRDNRDKHVLEGVSSHRITGSVMDLLLQMFTAERPDVLSGAKIDIRWLRFDSDRLN